MIFVAELSLAQGLIDQDLVDRHRRILSDLNLPISLMNVAGSGNWESLYSAMTLDKKSRGSSIRFVALTEVGNCTRIGGVTEAELKSAYEKVLS